MAFQDDFAYIAGSVSTWTSAGGSGIGGAITCTSLATVTSRQGAKSGNLIVTPPGGSTAVLPDFLLWKLQVQMVSTPVVGEEVQLYLGFSDSTTAGTDNPGQLTGTDAVGPNVDILPQLVFAGSLMLSANLTTGVQLAYLSPVPPLDAYVCPVIYNGSTKAFDGTAAHTILTMIPYYRERQT